MKLDPEALLRRFLPEFKLDLGFFDKLKLIFSKKKRLEIIKEKLKGIGEQFLKGFSRFRAIADNTPLRKKLVKYLDKGKIEDTDFICGFVSLDTGLYHSVSHTEFASDDDLVNAVLSSSCIPMIWEPVRSVAYHRNGEFCISYNNIDGGVNNVSPLGDVVNRIISTQDKSEYKIIVINCHSGYNLRDDFSDKNIAQIALRSMYEIAFTEIFNNDVKHFLKINDLVRQAKAWDDEIMLFDNGFNQYREFDAVVIQPHKDFDLGNGLAANEKLINLRATHGEEMARLAFEKRRT